MVWFGFVLGVLLSHLPSAFPPVFVSAGVTLLGAGVWLLSRRPACPRPRWQQAFLLAGVGLAYGCWQHQQHLDQRLSEPWMKQPIAAQLQVIGLPRLLDERQQVDALLSVEGRPRIRVLAYWPAGHPRLQVGEHWQAQVRLSSLRGLANFHGFDGERLAWSRGWQARADIRDPAPLAAAPGAWSWEAMVNRWRDHWRQAMWAQLEGKTWAAVVVALALGDQAGVRREDWDLFQQTGITHLISISGIHVTMLALMAAGAVSWTWRRCRWRDVRPAEKLPAQWVAAGVGLVVAALYCMLAGWGVPAQRTWLMLAIMVVGQWGHRSLSFWQRWVMAAAAIVALDPAAVLAVGFWLSFGAVALLLWSGAGRWRKPAAGKLGPWPSRLGQAAYFQLAVTLGMLPLGIVFFNQVSWISPLANAVAIPVMTWLITPLSLLSLCLLMVNAPEAWAQYGLSLANGICDAQMRLLALMARMPGASQDWPQMHPLAVLPALLGVIIALAPRGGIPRRWGLCLMMSLLIPASNRLSEGEWELVALDVGQGSALVLRYEDGVLVFDTGPASRSGWSAGQGVLLPHFKGEGIRRLNYVVVSHEDQDHASGIPVLSDALPIERAYSSFPVQGPDGLWQLCEAGLSWSAGGLHFRFLHPDAAQLARVGEKGDSPNARSCVLDVTGKHHRLVLTGDIGRQQEEALLDAGIEPADVVIAAHHGSRSSSSAAWVRRMRARLVIVQAGYGNRYGHPHPLVLARWQASGAQIYRTDLHGALRLRSSSSGLALTARRQQQSRYWRDREVPH